MKFKGKNRQSTDTTEATPPSGSASAVVKSSNDELNPFLSQIALKDPGLKTRDWLVIVAELFLSLAWISIRDRRRSEDELKKRGMTEREETIDFLFWESWVIVGSLIVGIVVDSHVSYYTVAVLNVIYHFSVSSFIFMEEMITSYYVKENPYSDIIAVIVTISILVAKSTDFTRLLLGLYNLKTKEDLKVSLFLFMFMWVGGKFVDGGVLWTFLGTFNLGDRAVAGVALVVSGVSSYLYVFVFKPISPNLRHIEGHKVTGCLISALVRKIYKRNVRSRGSWKDFADHRYDRRTVLAAKDFLGLLKKLCPTIGYALYVALVSEGFISSILTKLKPTGLFYYTGITTGIKSSIFVSMLITQFVFIPLSSTMIPLDKFYIRFFIGYVTAILSIFYVAFVFTSWEGSGISSSVGNVRIFNLRDSAVNFSTRDPGFTNLNFSVSTDKALSLYFSTRESELFKMAIDFEPEMSWVMHLSVAPLISSGYVLSENAPYVIKIKELPIEEGPPGTNNFDRPRLYLFNSIREGTFPFSIRKSKTKEEVIKMKSRSAELHVFQLPEGQYDLVLINLAQLVVNVSIGGVYGILLHSDGLLRRIFFDETLQPNTLQSSLSIGFVVPAGISAALAFVSLEAIAFTSAPAGLLGMTFGFLTSLQYFSSWIIYIGYKTWHHYPSAEALYTYGICQIILLLTSLFVFTKYKS